MSAITVVEFAVIGEHAPIEFSRASTNVVRLHFVNVPNRGFVEIMAFSKSASVRKERKSCAAVAFDHEVLLQPDETLRIECHLVEESTHQAGLMLLHHLDPARDRDVTIDLGGTARVVSLEAPGVELRGDAWIAMFRVESGFALPGKLLRSPCVDGRSSVPIIVPSGRWLYVYSDGLNAHAIFGVIDAGAADEGSPLVLRPALELRSASELGREIVFSEIDGVSLEKMVDAFRHIRWKNVGDLVAVPKNARYEILEQ